MNGKHIFIAVVLIATFVFSNPGVTNSSKVRTRFVTIGTGSVTGVYYPTGGAIARIVNSKRKEYGIRVTVVSTGGALFNVNAVVAGDLEFGIVQSDRQYQAYNGIDVWKERGPVKDLRAVFSIYAESLTLVTADDAQIQSLNDLRGRRVNIGNPGSRQRQMSIDALYNAGIGYNNDILAESFKASEASDLLQDNRIDAFFYTVGHPNGYIKEATMGRRKVHFVPIMDVRRLLERNRYYTRSVIPIEFYPRVSNKLDIVTFGVRATLVTTSKIPDEIVYVITKEVFDNLEDFKRLHPAYKGLTRQNMLEGLTAPIHPGAMKYYKETGIK